MKMYIHHLQDRIRQVGVRVEPYITQSNGGVMSISSTIQTPVQTALSRPQRGGYGRRLRCQGGWFPGHHHL